MSLCQLCKKLCLSLGIFMFSLPSFSTLHLYVLLLFLHFHHNVHLKQQICITSWALHLKWKIVGGMYLNPSSRTYFYFINHYCILLMIIYNTFYDTTYIIHRRLFCSFYYEIVFVKYSFTEVFSMFARVEFKWSSNLQKVDLRKRKINTRNRCSIWDIYSVCVSCCKNNV